MVIDTDTRDDRYVLVFSSKVQLHTRVLSMAKGLVALLCLDCSVKGLKVL